MGRIITANFLENALSHTIHTLYGFLVELIIFRYYLFLSLLVIYHRPLRKHMLRNPLFIILYPLISP